MGRKFTIFLAFISFVLFSSCNDRYKEYPNLSAKEIEALDAIKDACEADNIKLSQADSFNVAIENSISITVWNSKIFKLTDSSLADRCYWIARKFIESSQPQRKYALVEVKFEEGTDILIYHNKRSKGQLYYRGSIDDIIEEINDPNNILEQLEQKNAYDSLLTYTQRLIENNKNVDVALGYQGIAYYNLHDTIKAIERLTAARQMNKIAINFPMNLAIMYGSRNQYSTALKYIDTVLTMESQSPAAIYYHGLYSFYNGDKLKGCEYLLKAEKLGVSEATAFLEFNCR